MAPGLPRRPAASNEPLVPVTAGGLLDAVEIHEVPCDTKITIVAEQHSPELSMLLTHRLMSYQATDLVNAAQKARRASLCRFPPYDVLPIS